MVIAKQSGFKICQAFIDPKDLTLEQQQFLAHFNDGAPYQKAVRGLSLTMYEDCGWCRKPHLREEHTFNYCEDSADGILKEGNPGAPCQREVQSSEGMFWNDYLRTCKPFRHEKLAIVFPNFVMDQIGINQYTKVCPNAMSWSEFKQHNWQSRYYGVLFAIRYDVKARKLTPPIMQYAVIVEEPMLMKSSMTHGILVAGLPSKAMSIIALITQFLRK